MKRFRFIGVIIYWLLWPLAFLILNKSHRSRVIITFKGKVLFVKNWLGENKYGLPGGGIKSHESSLEGAIREVREETGITLEAKDFKLIEREHITKQHGIVTALDLYLVKLADGTDNLHKSSVEIMERSWFDPSEVIRTKRISKSTSELLQIWLAKRHLLD